MAGPAPAPAPAGPSGLGGFNGALPALPSPAAGVVTNPVNPYGGMIGQIGGALAAYPALLQQQQEQKLKLQQQQSAYAQQQLAMIGQYVSANPQYADNPQVAQRIAQLSQQAGVPPPLTSDGKVDVTAIMGSNKQDWNQLSPEQQQSFEQMPTVQRQAALKSYRNVPPDVLAADQYQTQATTRALASDVTHLLASPNTANLKDAYAIIQKTASGGTADPVALDDMTNSMQSRWEQTFALRTAAFDLSKTKAEDVDTWHKASLALDQAKLDAIKANNQAKLQVAQAKIDQAQQRLQVEALKAQSYVSTSKARVQAYVSSIQNKNAATSTIMVSYKALTAERASTEANMAKLQASIASASSEANTAQAQQMYATLQAQEAQIDAAIKSYGPALDAATNHSVSSQTGGKPVTTVGGAGAAAPKGSEYGVVTGQATMNGQTFYQYADGSIRNAGTGQLVDKNGQPINP
jgi:hypothetical protein